MSMSVIFLGTAAAVPTQQRSLPAVLLTRENEQILFDCGEAVQRQMILAKVGLHKKMSILITHMHGDHVLGLPGLLQTMALLDRQKPVNVFGPIGINQFLTCLKETLQFQLTFEVHVHEISKPGIVCEEKDYLIEATASNHTTPSFSFAFIEKPRLGKFHPEKVKALGIPQGEAWSELQHGTDYLLPSGQTIKAKDVTDPPRKGRKIVYTGDTRPFQAFAKFASDANLVIHEATFDDSIAEKALLDGHSTPIQAATETLAANAKLLVLTHISARYSDDSLLLEQAKKIFPNTLMAKDFLKLELPLGK
jgi:ribonuclease Z